MPKLFFTSPEFEKLSGVRHAFFTKNLPGSNYVYTKQTFERLHLTGSAEELIEKNTRILLDNSPFPIQKIAYLDQQHSNHAVIALSNTHADGQVTTQPGVALAVLTADCVPVLLADEKKRIIGAAHAGWKGAVSGILENTVALMNQMGSQNDHITAVLGPCIFQANYEVGPEFLEKLGSMRYLKKSSKIGHWLFDLQGYVCDKLEQLKLKRVLKLDVNTFEDQENCLSYRRDCLAGNTFSGNLVSLIMLA